jgi:type IV secretory pathway VirJ component
METCSTHSVSHTQQPWLHVPRAVSALLLLMCAAVMCQCGADGDEPAPDRLTRAPFGPVRVYRPHGEVRSLALLVSGDGGWGAGVGSIAQDLAGQDTLVAGIDGKQFLRGLGEGGAPCASPATELAQLAQWLIARYHLPPQSRATLVGHSAGASLVYVALAQAAPGTFTGALTLSFCTELDLRRPLCPAAALRGLAIPSGTQLQPGGVLPAPWIAVHGREDPVCPAEAGARFAGGVPGTRFIEITGVDHNYRDRARWWPAFVAGYRQLSQPQGSAPPGG